MQKIKMFSLDLIRFFFPACKMPVVAWVFFCCLFVFLFYLVNESAFFVDEYFTKVIVSAPSLGGIMLDLIQGPPCMYPLYVTLLHFWTLVFGASVNALRYPSAIFTFLFFYHSYCHLVTRKFDVYPIIFCFVTIFACPVFIVEAVNARPYSLVLFLFSLSFWSVLSLKWDSGLFLRLAVAFVLSLLVLSHGFGAVYVLTLGVSVCFLSRSFRCLVVNMFPFVVAGIVGLVCFWLFSAQRNYVPRGFEIFPFIPCCFFYFLNSYIWRLLIPAGVFLFFICGRRFNVWSDAMLVSIVTVFVAVFVFACFDFFAVIELYGMMGCRYLLILVVPFLFVSLYAVSVTCRCWFSVNRFLFGNWRYVLCFFSFVVFLSDLYNVFEKNKIFDFYLNLPGLAAKNCKNFYNLRFVFVGRMCNEVTFPLALHYPHLRFGYYLDTCNPYKPFLLAFYSLYPDTPKPITGEKEILSKRCNNCLFFVDGKGFFLAKDL